MTWLTHSNCWLSHRTYEDVRCQSDRRKREGGISMDGEKDNNTKRKKPQRMATLPV